ncbi:putative Dol-P-Glc:Glc(2)Man(9)GlcNAc(2)-PP-Dol alpha-1,2-glucosyltransferase [Anoplophora glabripennis]|uniref:putative Dol-P-Glc:Glc(2)Man(9)GlcNAc(2)-PP-Dol alpha-1,2-glucosyltransferase n=1 Tax=Anoplophora glabripennis TaxID=217634 RepID=UPI00087538C1|nr:putative Dol-P-Glc:Glc(2)Man(9)GlcNAc(2)-PP-Dol alpha-1,2-glucosyltransferase [Anoplophora glabripennis]
MADLFTIVKQPTVCLVLSIFIYFIISKIIFDNVYLTSNMVVDEEFHIPLGHSYCELDFSQWDPKVTTLPGLYVVSMVVLSPFHTCSSYALRFVSLLASVVNILLFYHLLSKHEESKWGNVLSALTLALLPPLYFFSHFYYTDVVALTMTLAMLVLSEKGYHYYASVFGFISVLCRQTNIIWVALVAGKYALTELYKIAMHRAITRETEHTIPSENFYQFIMQLLRRPKSILLNTSLQFWLDLSAYATILITFVVFIILNGSVVVGDKSAHEVAVHIPQLFYYSLFCLIFSWPHFVGEVISFTFFARRHKLLILSSILLGIFLVYANTLVHPYLLADNRHYFFYVWNRFYGKYALFRYFMVPVYVFSWYVILKILYDKNDMSFLILYLLCIFLVLSTHKLVDVRYYFIPYIIFRLRIKNNTSTVFNVILEFVTFCVINAISFNLFYTKTIIWEDYEAPQRLIW